MKNVNGDNFLQNAAVTSTRISGILFVHAYAKIRELTNCIEDARCISDDGGIVVAATRDRDRKSSRMPANDYILA